MVTAKSDADVWRYQDVRKLAIILESGFERTSILAFNYDNPPKPPTPSWLYHYEKMAFNKAYWYLVLTGVMGN